VKKKAYWIVGGLVIVVLMIVMTFPYWRPRPHYLMGKIHPTSNVSVAARNLLITHYFQIEYKKKTNEYAKNYLDLNKFEENAIAMANSSYSNRESPDSGPFNYRIFAIDSFYVAVTAPDEKFQKWAGVEGWWIMKINEKKEFYMCNFKEPLNLFEMSFEDLYKYEWISVKQWEPSRDE